MRLPCNAIGRPCASSRLQKGHFRIKKCCHGALNGSASRVQADDTVAHEWCQCTLEVVPAYNQLIQPEVFMEKRMMTAKHNLSEFTALRRSRIDTSVGSHELISFEERLTV